MEAIGAIKPSHEIKVGETVLGSVRSNSDPDPKPTPAESGGVERHPGSDRAAVREDSQVKIERVAKAMDNYLKSIQRDLQIQVHADTGNFIVKVLSREDGRIIREIPPEAMLNLAARMEEMIGVLFDENV